MENIILQGDCLEILGRMEPESVDAIIADPPYGINYQSNQRTKSEKHPKIQGDKKPYVEWLPEAFRVLKLGGALVCFTRFDVESVFREAMVSAGFSTKAQLIWDKVVHRGMGDLYGDFMPVHENAIFATKGKFKFPNKRPKTLLSFKRIDSDKQVHPNEKPSSLMRYLVEHLTTPGQTVLDPFCGVGPTLIAAQETGRNYIGCDLSETYIEIAKKRLDEAKSPIAKP